MKDLVQINFGALAKLDQSLEAAGKLAEAAAFKPAEWFDTPEKRLSWWFELEPQWKKAFQQAVFFRRHSDGSQVPDDRELQYLFHLDFLNIVGAGHFRNRNNSPSLDFQLTNLNGVKNLTNLITIHADYNGHIESLEPLSRLDQLSELWCDNNNISDISPIAHLPNLTSLCCWNNNISDISPLTITGIIRDLNIGLYDQGNPISSWEPLRHLASLIKLDLCGCDISSLEPLEHCPKLRWLSVSPENISRQEVARFSEKVNYRVIVAFR